MKKPIIKFLNKKGSGTLITILISMALITFILFFPIGVFKITQNIALVEDVLSMSLQTITVEGGLTDRAEDIIFANMEGKGLISPGSATDLQVRDKIILECSADCRDGAVGNIVYKTDPDPIISFSIWYPANDDIGFVKSLGRMLYNPGTTDENEYYYTLSGHVLSERVRD